MKTVIAQRMTATIDGDFVVFLIGMRINRPWKVHKWLPVVRAMPRLLRELEAAGPAIGFLGHNGLGRPIVQYWRSFADLEAYARARDRQHWPAWTAFNRAAQAGRGDVGIWHETYLVRAGEYETLYSGMPRHGLGRAGDLQPATGRRATAAQRLAGTGTARSDRRQPPGP